jgi:hypothetical protein
VALQDAAIDAEATPLRGAAARIVTNMNASLAVPTATSVRTVAARLLEINRVALNESLSRSSGAKVSFTHLIAFAIVKGLGVNGRVLQRHRRRSGGRGDRARHGRQGRALVVGKEFTPTFRHRRGVGEKAVVHIIDQPGVRPK